MKFVPMFLVTALLITITTATVVTAEAGGANNDTIILIKMAEQQQSQQQQQPYRFLSNHSSVVNNLQSLMLTRPDVYAGIQEAVAQAQAPQPLTVPLMLELLDQYINYIPSPEHPSHALNALGNRFFNHAVWTDPAVAKVLLELIQARGSALYSPLTQSILPAWMESSNVTIDDCIVPEGGFKSWGEFFTRKVKPSARPIANATDPSLVVSPVDAQLISVTTAITEGTKMMIKGMPVNITALVGGGDETLSKKYLGGTGLLLWLSVYNYHRWNAPVSGNVSYCQVVPGSYYGVPNAAESTWVPSFGYYFNRAVLEFQIELPTSSSSSTFSTLFVPVGLAEFGSVVPYIAAGTNDLKKGDLIGQFDLGGSAVFMAFDNSVDVQVIPPDYAQVKMGEALVKVQKKATK